MNDTMSIAIVTETCVPEINGVSLTLERMVRHLRERGHLVSLVRPRQQADGDAAIGGMAPGDLALLTRGLPLPRYPGLQFGLPAPRLLLQQWRAQRPDVVHIVTEGPLGWSALAVAHRLGIPVSTDYRTHFDKYSGYYRLGALATPIAAALRSFHNRSDLTFVPTHALAAEMAEAGYRRLCCIGRGVDGLQFSPCHRSAALRERWGLEEGGLAVLHVGRLAPEKNPLLARAAFRAIRREQPRARLVWVGDGPMRAELERDADGEVFAGMRRGASLSEHYASADLFLFPSQSETFGNVVLEAMASALPIVAFDIGAAREHLVDRISARVVAVAAGEGGFIETARRLADHAAERRFLGAVARDTTRRLSWAQVLGGFESQLAACVARHGVVGHVVRPA